LVLLPFPGFWLIEQLEKAEDARRVSALAALGIIGEKASTAIPAVAKRAANRGDFSRSVAIQTLSHIGTEDVEVLEIINHAYNDPDSVIRRVARDAFSLLEAKDRRASEPKAD